MKSNSICMMTEAEKIRLCATIFSSNAYTDKKFWPSKHYIEPDCYKVNIFAHARVNKLGIKNIFYRQEILEEVEFMYQEWMIGCKAVTIGIRDVGVILSYYVSRGYDAHTAIVYKRSLQDVYVADIGLSRVSVITERGVIRHISEYSRRGFTDGDKGDTSSSKTRKKHGKKQQQQKWREEIFPH